MSLNAGARLVLQHASGYAGSVLSSATGRIRGVQPGDGPCKGSGKAAIYVTYDRWSLLADYVVEQVAALARAGRDVTFVCNSPQLPEQAAARIRPHVGELVHRRNYGHDFGAYKDAIARLDLPALDSLVLMNDSCYGPFVDLAGVDAAAAASRSDIFGITESWSQRYHLQTYYVWIGHAAVRSREFALFWRRLLPHLPRDLVILRGEIGFTQAMLKAGFTASALCPYPEAARHAQEAVRRRLQADPDISRRERAYLEELYDALLSGETLNPTHSFWDVLITECGAPFLKRELLRKNPLRIPGLSAWEKVIAGFPGADVASVRRHLKLG
jgi:hypothetical protein